MLAMIAQSVQSVPSVAVRRGHGARGGFSLLELILALAILALAVAAISQLVRLGLSHAKHARELTKAELYCESTMAELAAGVLPLEGVTDVPIEQDSEWLYSVTVEPAAIDGLLVVTVTVYQAEPDPVRPIEFTLVRWLPDPEVFSAQETETSSLGTARPSARADFFAPQPELVQVAAKCVRLATVCARSPKCTLGGIQAPRCLSTISPGFLVLERSYLAAPWRRGDTSHGT